MTEKALQAKVMRKLEEKGGHFDNNSPSRWDRRGRADLTGCYHAYFVAIELKQPGKYKYVAAGLSKAQQHYLESVISAGGIAIVADSWEMVEKYLDNEGFGNYWEEMQKLEISPEIERRLSPTEPGRASSDSHEGADSQ